MTTAYSDCPFCQRWRKGEFDETDFRNVMSFEPLNPVTPGHRLFMPTFHIARADSEPLLAARVFEAAAWYAGRYGDSYNLITSGGRDATQSVFHLHVHYVPRTSGDGLILPWTTPGGVHG